MKGLVAGFCGAAQQRLALAATMRASVVDGCGYLVLRR